MATALPAAVRSAKPRERLVRGVRYWIREGVLEPGARLPSEHALAAEFDVARSTVRLALQQLQVEGVIQANGRARVVSPPAPAAGGSTWLGAQTVVVLADAPTAAMPSVPLLHGWSHYLHVGASEYLRLAGLHVMTVRTDLLDAPLVDHLLADRPRGMIVLGNLSNQPRGPALLARLVRGGIPLVSMSPIPGLAPDTVNSDHATGCALLVDWLLARGHRRILRLWGLNAGPPRPAWLAQRDLGYTRAVTRAGAPVLPAVEYQTFRVPGDEAQAFQTYARHVAGLLLEHLRGPQRPDAIMVVSDGLAMSAAAACRLHGLEPQRDIAIVGYDNYWADVPERRFEPTIPLATVDKDNLEIGRQLVELLLARARGELPPAPQHRLVSPHLVLPTVTQNLPQLTSAVSLAITH